MEAFRQNISFGLRTLFKNKGFTITAVLTLALGIGATTAIFSVVYAVLEPMPYPNPAALLACLFPAWRARRVEPLEALRYE